MEIGILREETGSLQYAYNKVMEENSKLAQPFPRSPVVIAVAPFSRRVSEQNHSLETVDFESPNTQSVSYIGHENLMKIETLSKLLGEAQSALDALTIKEHVISSIMIFIHKLGAPQ